MGAGDQRPDDDADVLSSREVTLTLTQPSWPEQRVLSSPSAQRDGWSRCAGDERPAPISAAFGAWLADAGHDSVLALVDRVRIPEHVETALDPCVEMNERYALDDFSGAMDAAERILKRDPDHDQARTIRRAARQKLERLLRARVSALGTIPVLQADAVDRRWLSLDPRVAALLPYIDGVRDCAALVDASGLTPIAALRALLDLVEARVVRLV